MVLKLIFFKISLLKMLIRPGYELKESCLFKDKIESNLEKKICFETPAFAP